ncbi:hypothetical protein ASA1KI_39380 [Opitutales bacterium ASA1]|nr:hypothetical protein ASA1KI_39380 [Opitutales bacterium ASA1]
MPTGALEGWLSESAIKWDEVFMCGGKWTRISRSCKCLMRNAPGSETRSAGGVNCDAGECRVCLPEA